MHSNAYSHGAKARSISRKTHPDKRTANFIRTRIRRATLGIFDDKINLFFRYHPPIRLFQRSRLEFLLLFCYNRHRFCVFMRRPTSPYRDATRSASPFRRPLDRRFPRRRTSNAHNLLTHNHIIKLQIIKLPFVAPMSLDIHAPRQMNHKSHQATIVSSLYLRPIT